MRSDEEKELGGVRTTFFYHLRMTTHQNLHTISILDVLTFYRKRAESPSLQLATARAFPANRRSLRGWVIFKPGLNHLPVGGENHVVVGIVVLLPEQPMLRELWRLHVGGRSGRRGKGDGQGGANGGGLELIEVLHEDGRAFYVGNGTDLLGESLSLLGSYRPLSLKLGRRRRGGAGGGRRGRKEQEQ